MVQQIQTNGPLQQTDIKIGDPDVIDKILEDIDKEWEYFANDDETNPWVQVNEQSIKYNYEMLYAFHDPMSCNFPVIRICRILQDTNEFIVCSVGCGEHDINLGDYRKLGEIYVKKLPMLPESMWPSVYYEC